VTREAAAAVSGDLAAHSVLPKAAAPGPGLFLHRFLLDPTRLV